MSEQKNLRIAASTLIKTGYGTVRGIFVSAASATPTLKLQDGITATADAAVAATDILTSDATNVSNGETVTIDQTIYRFMTVMTQAYDVQIGADAATTLDNLKAAINASGTPGTEYFTGTLIHPSVTATTNTNTAQTIAANTAGAGANSIPVLESSAHLSWATPKLAGGLAASRTIIDTFTPVAGTMYNFGGDLTFSSGLFAIISGTVTCTLIYD